MGVGWRGRWLAQEVVGMGGGWHRNFWKCKWAAEELQVVVAQEMQVGAGGVSAQEVRVVIVGRWTAPKTHFS